MQIVCPACAARYELPETRLAPGRRVKCARCGDSWTPIEPEPAPETAPSLDPVSEREPAPAPAIDVFSEAASPELSTSAPAPTPAPAPGGKLLWAGWAATALLVVACVLLASQFRIQIEHAWPPSRRLYDLL